MVGPMIAVVKQFSASFIFSRGTLCIYLKTETQAGKGMV